MVSFAEPRWTRISEECKNLVKRMIERDPERRVSAEEALKHPWFNSKSFVTSSPSPIPTINRYDNIKAMEKDDVKKEFGVFTCTPLLNHRTPNAQVQAQISPLILPNNEKCKKEGLEKVSPILAGIGGLVI